jgi:ribulose-phosphate 3-epimerase
MIIPVVLEKHFEEVINKVKAVESFSPLIQIDISDGKLVDGETFTDIKLINTLQTESEVEIHLMVVDPQNYVIPHLKRVKTIYAQVEAFEHVNDFIERAYEFGYEPGLSINPGTDVAMLVPYLNEIKKVQFMTVQPGAQGRPFDPGVIGKVQEFIKENPHVHVQVDGGINEHTLLSIVAAGIDAAVVGSAVVRAQNPEQEYKRLMNMFEQGRI